jgi:hypothetical protein
MEIDPSHIKNTRDFRSYVLLLADGIATTTTRSLEEYLQALWSLIQHAQDQPVTYAMLGQLLHDAFLTEVPPFDEMMLQYEAPPDLDDDEAPPDLNDDENGEPFTTLQQMICYQIADLHRMAQTGLLENPLRYYGIDSPTGHRWFNFAPASYLQCAAQSLQEDGIATNVSWMDLAILLWLGQIYE